MSYGFFLGFPVFNLFTRTGALGPLCVVVSRYFSSCRRYLRMHVMPTWLSFMLAVVMIAVAILLIDLPWRNGGVAIFVV